MPRMSLNHCQSLSALESSGAIRVSCRSETLVRVPRPLTTSWRPPEPAWVEVLTPTSMSRPETAVSALMTSPSISRKKFCATIGSLVNSPSTTGVTPWEMGPGGTGRQGKSGRGLLGLADPEDHELGRLDRRQADLDDELARRDAVGGVGRLVALDVVGLVGRGPEQGAGLPQAVQVAAEGAGDAFPQGDVVGLEHRPLGALHDGGLHHVEQAAHVDVLPVGVRGQGARTPDPDPAGAEGPDAVDPDRVQQALLGL